MIPSHSRILAVLLASIVLIGGANLAVYAANGKRRGEEHRKGSCS